MPGRSLCPLLGGLGGLELPAASLQPARHPRAWPCCDPMAGGSQFLLPPGLKLHPCLRAFAQASSAWSARPGPAHGSPPGAAFLPCPPPRQPLSRPPDGRHCVPISSPVFWFTVLVPCPPFPCSLPRGRVMAGVFQWLRGGPQRAGQGACILFWALGASLGSSLGVPMGSNGFPCRKPPTGQSDLSGPRHASGSAAGRWGPGSAEAWPPPGLGILPRCSVAGSR